MNKKMKGYMEELRVYVASKNVDNLTSYVKYKDDFFKGLGVEVNEADRMFLNQLLYDNWNRILDTGII